jgi:uncharacterized protein (DUF1800 family)
MYSSSNKTKEEIMKPEIDEQQPSRLHWQRAIVSTVMASTVALSGVSGICGFLMLHTSAAIGAVASTVNANVKLTDADARHLLNRVSFAASSEDIAAFTGLTRAQATDRLLATSREVAATPPPSWVGAALVPAGRYRGMSREEREAELKLNAERAIDLREWWFREMLTTPSPLTEKMTLFWHNHFATSQQKVKQTALLYHQNVLLRKYALGNFRTMLHLIARDPAMLIYLDNANSRKEQPNENFAREVMELFTLGEGNYTERDIKEMARAFTGWSLDRETGEFMFRRNFHDTGEKTIFGKRGVYEGDQALDLLLQRPETAQFITRKLWREFVSPDPDEAEVNRLATIYRESGYNNAKLMRAMLTSDVFYAAQNRASLIKSPVEFVVGTMKMFEIEASNLRPFVLQSALLGQNVFSPPNVKGWPGGETWINSASLLGRKQFIERLFKNDDRGDARNSMNMATMNNMADMAEAGSGNNMPGSAGRNARQQKNVERAMNALKWDLNKWASHYNDGKGVDGPEQMSKVLLAVTPSAMPASNNPSDWARLFVADPAYQLK